jgi:hypothetical protein
MKVDLSKLTLPRLKAYRKSLLPRVAVYETCDCGSTGCSHAYERSRSDPRYQELRAELDNVNVELRCRQRKIHEAEEKKRWANNVWTDQDQRRFEGKGRRCG